MIEKKLAEKLNKDLARKKRVLFLDPKGEYEFLLDHLEDELESGLVRSDHPFKTKYLAEKDYREEPCVIYTGLERDELDYLAEYAATGAVFEKPLTEFVKEEFGVEGLDEKWIKVAAHASLEGDEEFWQNIRVKGKSGILGDLDRKALHFLTEPEERAESLKEEDTFELFQSAVRDNYGIEAPPGNPKSLADELARATLLAGLSEEVLEAELGEFSDKGKNELKDLYRQWMDSDAGRQSFNEHVEDVSESLEWDKLLSEIVPWDLDPEHPFRKADKKMQQQYLERELSGDDSLKLEQKDFIYERGSSQAVKALKLPNWQAFTLLVEYFDNRDEEIYSDVESLGDFLDSYVDNLWRLDAARRLSYEELSDEDLSKKIQAVYREEWSGLDDLWYGIVEETKELEVYNGVTIKEGIRGEEKVAVILADGLRYELAEQLRDRLEDLEVDLGKSTAPLPTETSVGMGALTSSRNFSVTEDLCVKDEETGRKIEKVEERGENLEDLLGRKVVRRELSETSAQASEDEIPLIYYGDVDYIAEKVGKDALGYFTEIVDNLAAGIRELLEAGYESVYLTSDHGFVLNEPEAAEKIPTEKLNTRESSKRFVVGPNLQEAPGTLKLNPEYLPEEISVPRGKNVFKTPSTYEFMHGGASPQEVIVPKMKISKSGAGQEEKPAAVIDEAEPKKVKNRVFDIAIDLDIEKKSLFEEKRKVKLQIAREGEELFASSVIELSSGAESGTKVEVNLPEGAEEGKYMAYLLDGESGEKLDECELDYKPLRGDIGL